MNDQTYSFFVRKISNNLNVCKTKRLERDLETVLMKLTKFAKLMQRIFGSHFIAEICKVRCILKLLYWSISM